MLYGAAGFALAPRLLRSALLENIPKQTGATATVGPIRINPFLLQLEVKDFSLMANSGDRLLGFDRLFVDFGLASLWRRAFVFKDIEIDAPVVNAVVADDGSLNLAQLKPKSPAPPPPPRPEPQSLPRIQVAAFSVTRGVVSYEDRSRPAHFATRIEPITFDLRDFSTDAQGGIFTFTGASKRGERFDWHGHLSVQPVESDGQLRIQGLRAQTIGEYAGDKLGFVIDSGGIDIDARYRFALRDAVDLHVDGLNVLLKDLAIKPKTAEPANEPDWIVVPELEVTNGSLDLGARKLQIDTVSLTGLKLLTWMATDGSINLTRLAAPAVGPGPAAATATAAASTAAAAPGAAPNVPAWSVELRDFGIREANISFEDRSTSPAAKIVLAPLSLRVTGASLDLTRAVAINLEAKLNNAGEFAVSGDLTPQPLSADLGLKLKGFELKALQPYIAQRTAMSLTDGRLSASAKIRYGQLKPRAQVTGDLSVENLHTVDNQLREDFINWQRLDILGITFQQEPNRLTIDRIVALKPYFRVIIESDSSLNVAHILAGPTPARPPQAPSSTAPPPQAAAPPPVAAPPGMRPSVPPPGVRPSAPYSESIRSIELASGQANFSDLSVTPNFAAGIQELHGTVRGLSSEPNSRAHVDLHGQVDPFAPVAISGEVNVLSPALYTDMTLSFRNIELSIFNPYSGKFAGYAISKGKLTTEFNYKVDGRKLDAKHHVIIDQLEFGEKTASKDAVTLPVKLAVALLKDRNGVIDLDLPVSGSLDDPNFHLAPAIWKFLGNLLVKAVTAPFALLGSLFGGGPDMQFVDFHPGAATLDGAGAEKLKVIIHALQERPQLKLEVPIAILPEVDRPALIEARFIADAQAEQALQPNSQLRFDQLEPAARLRLLTTLYGKKFAHAPKFPDSTGGKQTQPEEIAARIAFLEAELRARIVVDDADLQSLAQQRALALQQALLTDTALDPARVFLVASGKIKSQDGLVRLELSLQ